jgi:hypothetical protein
VNRQAVIAGVIALVVVTATVGGILYSTRHNKVQVTGDILKVRSHQRDVGHTLVVLDFRVTNPSTQPFTVREVEVFLDTKDGKSLKADIFAEIDAQRMFDYYKVLGEKYNRTLVLRERLNSGQTIDRMIAVQFDTSDEVIQDRKALRMVVHEVLAAAKSEIVEVRK